MLGRRLAPQWKSWGVKRLVALLALTALGGLLAFGPAAAQMLAFPPVPAPSKKTVRPETDKQMLVQAREINYDYSNKRVAAVGNVQIYYGGSTLEADRVIYDETTKRLHAEGNARLTDSEGKTTYGEIMDLSDDYRDGFVDSLRLDAPDQTRFAAARADRSQGNFTVFHNGIYTACEPCKDDPKKPPLWQIKAARIIHDQQEKMIYFEDATLDFFGKSLIWFPYFSAPDPTVKRKTGFLIPTATVSTKTYGFGVEIPFYWAIAPNYDATFAPKITTREGVLWQGEFRQRLLDGAYAIRGSAIDQTNPSYFVNDANRTWRGSVESEGKFAINKQWTWGWEAVLLSDKYFLQDYTPSLSAYRPNPERLSVTSEAVSQVFISGAGSRSYFDARSIYYLGLSGADQQSQIPIVHPVIDYDYTFDHPILGGQLGYNLNFTSLSRQQADFQAISRAAFTDATAKSGLLTPTTLCLSGSCSADPRQNYVLRGIPGDYNRFSAKSEWKREIADPYGQVFTPFAYLRADAASMQINNDPNVSSYIQTGDSNLVRAMPAVGVDYKYPFISVQSWGTQTLTPRAQVIARPNETQIGRWPNEDAQSFIFDTSNLFRMDKFAGWDRVEGGGRTNYGVEYNAQFTKSGSVTAMFGQSYQLYGANSYALADTTNTGLDSGLDTRLSDYVGSVSYRPNQTLTFSSRARFDTSNFDVKRLELETTAAFDRWSVTLLYGDYAAQPDIGFLDRRQGILGTARVKLASNWVAFGGARYDLNAEKLNGTNFGIGYIDDCLILALNYITGYSYSSATTNAPYTVVSNQQIMLQLSLRTLGSTLTTQTVGTNGTSGTSGNGLF
jgi:LPS-assembly protein